MTRAIPARLLVALAVVTGHAAEDLPGAADPPGLERFPGSWIVAYTPPAMLRSYEFVTGRVDRSGRTARVDDSMRLAAEVVRVTYRAADGTRFDEVVEHYRNQILDRGADVVFTCEARDCGRSTSWANSVFGVKELVAPDSSQFYLAARSPQPGSASGSPLAWNERTLIAVYVVQRGNRRIYAHVDLGTADAPPVPAEDTALAGRLRQQGYAVVAGVVPALDGGLDAADLAAVDAAARQIAGLEGRTVYVVCHLDAGGTEASMARSAACAETVVERLRRAGITAFGFGGGPLLPRSGFSANRVELVVPREPQ